MARLAFPNVQPGPVRDLLQALHDLHARAGRPSLDEIVRRQDRTRDSRDHFGRDAVHKLFSKCREAPRLPLLYEVVRILATMAPGTEVDTACDEFDRLWVVADRYDALRLDIPHDRHVTSEPNGGTPGGGDELCLDGGDGALPDGERKVDADNTAGHAELLGDLDE